MGCRSILTRPTDEAGRGGPTVSDRTAICFDLDETLLFTQRSADGIVRDALAAHCETVTDAMVEALTSELLAALDAADDESATDRVSAALDQTEGDGSARAGSSPASVDPDSLLATLRSEVLAATTVSDAARESLATLAADEGCIICLLTDGHHDWQREKLAHHDLEQYFTHVVTTADAGGTKQSGAPYDYLRETVAAAEYVMIGDDYAADVEAARAAGFVPIHYEETDGPDFFATLQAML
mgnify:FL=1